MVDPEGIPRIDEIGMPLPELLESVTLFALPADHVDEPVFPEGFTEIMEAAVLSSHDEPIDEDLDLPSKLLNADTGKVVLTAGGLTIAAAWYLANRRGIILDMDNGLRTIVESCAHPALGYLGALFVTLAAERLPRSRKIIAASIGALAVNFGTESVQELWDNNSAFDYWQNSSETLKDALFAIAGATLFFWQNRKIKSEV